MSPAKKQKLNTDDVVSELSESAFFQPRQTARPQTSIAASGQTAKPEKPHMDKYTTHLLPATIKNVKRYALEHDMKDYEVVQMALEQFLAPPPNAEENV